MLERYLAALEHDPPPRVTHPKQLQMLFELQKLKLVTCRFVYNEGKCTSADRIRVLRPKGPLTFPHAEPEDFYSCKSQRLLCARRPA